MAVIGEDQHWQQRELLQKIRVQANHLQTLLVRFEGTDEHSATLEQVITSLDELFLLVIVGEFNAGKSALINALLGTSVLEEGPIPTTTQITKLRYGMQSTRIQIDAYTAEQLFPHDFLKNISIIDTPGINAVLREHERLTESFIPRSDLILLVISADRSFTESERAFLARIRRWGKKVLIVLNKADLLRSQQDFDKVTGFIKDNCRRLLGFEPVIFPVSVLQAQQAQKAMGQDAIRLWEHSRIGALEDYLFHKLDESEQTRLKLSSPLGVMQRIIQETEKTVAQRQRLLADDEETVQNIERRLQQHRKRMEQNFAPWINKVENVVLETSRRADQFFDNTIRVQRSFDLLNNEKMKREFDEQVLSDSAARIDQTVKDLIDWQLEQEQALWQDILEYVDRRQRETTSRNEQMIGAVNRRFDMSRKYVLDSVRQEANKIVESYNRPQQAQGQAEALQNVVFQSLSAVAGGVAVGTVGVIVGTAIGSAFLDVTGIAAAIALIGLGLFILPYQRRRSKEKFDQQMQQLRAQLATAIKEQFDKGQDSAIQRVHDALAPYTSFVGAEQEKNREVQRQLTALQTEINTLRGSVEHL